MEDETVANEPMSRIGSWFFVPAEDWWNQWRIDMLACLLERIKTRFGDRLDVLAVIIWSISGADIQKGSWLRKHSSNAAE